MATSTPPTEDLCAQLQRLLPDILVRLGESSAWLGLRRVGPTGFTYLRLASTSELHVGRSAVTRLHVGLHSFEPQSALNQQHDHRFPIAVYPFSVDSDPRPLGQMVIREGSVERRLWLRSGQPYSLPAAGVTHAVTPHRPFSSVVLTSVSQGATRASRMEGTPLPEDQADTLRERMRAALASHLLSGKPGVGVPSGRLRSSAASRPR